MELKSLHILEGVTMYEALPTLGGGERVMEMGIVRERGRREGDAKMNINIKDEDEEEVKKRKKDEEVTWDQIKLGEIEE